ncbi:nuclear transport factor 2 family protein [Jatrophihabitans sp. DSM 45814]
MTVTTNLIADSISGYLALWNESDDGKRAKLAEQIFTADASYVDPMVSAAGRETIVATVGAVQQQFPGWTFRLIEPDSAAATSTPGIDSHHNLARFGWTLSPEGTEDPSNPAVAPIVGFDVAVVTTGGQITAVHGFLDKVPVGD